MELRKSRVGKECESFDTDGEEKRREEESSVCRTLRLSKQERHWENREMRETQKKMAKEKVDVGIHMVLSLLSNPESSTHIPISP